MSYQSTLLSGMNGAVFAALVGLTSCLLAQPVTAESARKSSDYIEEIIVTAQMREQSAQDIPVAVDAFTEEFLKDNNVEDLFDLQFFSPSLVVENDATTVDTTIRLRGVGTQSSVSLESSVGVYIDGVTRSRQASASTSLVDMARVEVVKGPQGTLFGRNAVSGVVQYVSVAPQAEYGGWLSFDAGNHGFTNVKGAINLPLAENVLAARISGSWVERDGFVKNLVTGNDIDDMNRYSVRAQFLWTPSDAFSARLIIDKTEFDEVCCTGTNVFDGPADTLAIFTDYGGIPGIARVSGVSAAIPQESANSTIFYAPAGAFVPTLSLLDPDGTRFPNGYPVNLAANFEDRVVSANMDPSAILDDSGISLELNWHLGENMTLTSITAFRKYEASGELDTDYTAWDSLVGNANSGVDQETFSQEFRLTGTSGDDLHYVVGAYYFQQSVDAVDFLDWGADMWLHGGGGLSTSQFMSLGLLSGIPPNFAALVSGGVLAALAPSAAVPYCQSQVHAVFQEFCAMGVSPFNDVEFSTNISNQDQTNWAFFGQVDYDITDDMILTLGLRYTHDYKEVDVIFAESSLNPGFAFFDPLNPLIPDWSNNIEDNVVTGTAKITYFLNDDVMVYASYGRGYKAGGFNLSRIGLTPDSGQAVGAEYFTTGAITQQIDQLASPLFDPEFVDAYEIGMKGDFLGGRMRANLAVFVSDFDDFQATAFVGNTFVLANAGKLSSDGVEVSIQALPMDWLSVFTSLNYISAEYDDFKGAPCDQTPFVVGGPQVCDNSGAKLGGTPEWSWVGSARAEREVYSGWNGFAQIDVRWNDETPYGADNDPHKIRDAYTLVNASIGLVSNEQRYEITLWGRNLDDEQYFLGVVNTVGREGSLTSRHSEPRTYGITLRANW